MYICCQIHYYHIMKNRTHADILVIMGLLALFYSCSIDKNPYEKYTSEWQGREIVFPHTMTDVITGDTIDLSEADFTILTYVDSAGCTSCKMKLSIWKSFLESLDSLAGERDVNAIIVINARDNRELSYLIQRDDYSYPIVNDLNDSLQTLNQFPDDIMLRTFLLDRNKHVMTIGNPAYNNAVAELYRSVISGMKTFNRPGTQMVTVNDPKKRIGNVKLGEVYTTNYTLNNESMDTVFVREVIPSCHCTEVLIPNNKIPPNGTLPVQIKFHEDSLTGDFIRSVYIYYQGFESPTILEISGIVIK